jgi:hypothetical protein
MADERSPASKALLHRGLAIAWIALLWLPVIQMVFRPFPEGPATRENRVKAAAPQPAGWGARALKDFTAGCERYFNDTFGFRDDLIRVHNLVHARLLGTSPLPALVIGRDDWLFYDKAKDGVNLADFCGLEPLSGPQLDAIEGALVSLRDGLQRRGVAFAVLIPPNKHTIYPELLPGRIRALAGTTRLDQLAGRLESRGDLLFVDVRPALLAGKARGPVYFRTDTHWNSYGARLAARALLGRLAGAGLPVAFAREEPLEPQPCGETQTDLAGMLGLAGRAPERNLCVREAGGRPPAITVLPVAAGRLPGHGTWVCENAATGPRFLMFQDSFGQALTSGLCRGFSHGVSIWDSVDFERTLDQEGPDVVILEIVERNLAGIPALQLLPGPARPGLDK